MSVPNTEADSSPAIEVRGLRKSYGDVEAVRGIDLSVSRGEVFALLGPNGAGKTTTVEILEGHRAGPPATSPSWATTRGSTNALSSSASASCCRRRASSRT